MRKINLKIVSNHKVQYFLDWELPFFRDHFNLVEDPSPDTVIFAYGPDAFFEARSWPAKKRVAILFPGFDFNPYHNIQVRRKTLQAIRDHYDAVFVNPGPVKMALEQSDRIFEHPFSVDVSKLIKRRITRKRLDSLLHLSADSPQKDWERSQEVMKLTGLPFEVFPPRQSSKKISTVDRLRWRFNKYFVRSVAPTKAFRFTLGYSNHDAAIKKYLEYDGFVHLAEEKKLPLHLDGKYTAALLEAAVTGCIIFWHDTYSLGNDFETIYSLSKEPTLAAAQIMEIRETVDIETVSKRTSEEVSERCDPRKVVGYRATVIESLI